MAKRLNEQQAHFAEHWIASEQRALDKRRDEFLSEVARLAASAEHDAGKAADFIGSDYAGRLESLARRGRELSAKAAEVKAMQLVFNGLVEDAGEQ